MKTEDAINHLKWKFTQSSSKASEKDKRSLNAIILALNKQNNTQLTDNINLCKLLMYTFKKMCLDSATRNMKRIEVGMTQKEIESLKYEDVNFKYIFNQLSDVFRMDAKSHLDSLSIELSHIKLQRLIDNNCLTPKTLLALTSKEDIKKATRRMLSEFIKNN